MFQTVDTDFSPGDSTAAVSAASVPDMFQTVDTDFSPGDNGVATIGIPAGESFRPLTRISLLVTCCGIPAYGLLHGMFQTVDTDFSPGDNSSSKVRVNPRSVSDR